MDFDVSNYNKTNQMQYNNGEQLINKIKEENNDMYVI
jgi:hypothetical protein